MIAVGTTVVRALEQAATFDGSIRAGAGLATLRIGAATPLCVVDAILTGVHEPGASDYALLHAFANENTLRRMDGQRNERGYRTHEFGDSVFVERIRCQEQSVIDVSRPDTRDVEPAEGFEPPTL